MFAWINLPHQEDSVLQSFFQQLLLTIKLVYFNVGNTKEATQLIPDQTSIMPAERLLCLLLGVIIVLCTIAPPASAQAMPGQASQDAQMLPRTVARIKPSVVGVGTQLKTRQPAIVFTGTGFIVGDGLSVITNAHVIPNMLNTEGFEEIGIVVGNGGEAVSFRSARVVGLDREHDLAHLRLSGAPLASLALAPEGTVAEGQALAFTGYPLGMRLGLHAATHRALLAAIAPVVRPSLNSRQLDPRAISQLQRRPFDIYHLDGTAYPGNSGSPLYDPASGAVVGVINMVFLKSLKESAVSDPSGITYAIPVRHVHALLQRSE